MLNTRVLYQPADAWQTRMITCEDHCFPGGRLSVHCEGPGVVQSDRNSNDRSDLCLTHRNTLTRSLVRMLLQGCGRICHKSLGHAIQIPWAVVAAVMWTSLEAEDMLTRLANSSTGITFPNL